MCGRYDLHASRDEIRAHFGQIAPDALGSDWATTPQTARYNVTPRALMPVVRYRKSSGRNTVSSLHWGFRPDWAEREWINARAETLFSARAFARDAQVRRCLVIATGWYEWQAIDGRKQPHYIHRGGQVFAFAGIWTGKRLPEGWLLSFAIVTTAASSGLERIHDRMPLVMHPRHYAAWVSPETAEPQELMEPFVDRFEARPVSTHVNRPQNDDEECIRPLSV